MKHSAAIIFGLVCLQGIICLHGIAFGAGPSSVSTEFPEIVYLEEMKPFPTEFKGCSGNGSAPIAIEISDSFQKEWVEMVVSVSVQVQSESIRGISRWARPQMASFTLPEHWLEKLSMEPIAHASDQRKVLFSQTVSNGLPLPSHSPLVFRRVLAAAEFDTRERRIRKVFITIRGWREE